MGSFKAAPQRSLIGWTLVLVMCFGAAGLVWVWYGGTDLRISQLKDPDPAVRAQAASVLLLRANLWPLHNRAVVEPLIAALKDPNSDIRADAAAALGNINDPRAIQPLIALLEDREPNVRRRAAYWLGKMKDRRAVVPLSTRLLKEDYATSDTVYRALVDIKDPGAVDVLLPGLKDRPELWQRPRVSIVLSEVGRSRAIELLLAALKDPDAKSRAHGARGLRHIGAAFAIPQLTTALNDPDSEVQLLATIALGASNSPQAVAPLIAALNNPGSHVRVEAAIGLVKLNQPEGVNAVRALVTAGGARAASELYLALIMLGSINTEGALVEALDKFGSGEMADAYLNSRNPKLRTAATEWAKGHGFEIKSKIGGSGTPSWGSKF